MTDLFDLAVIGGGINGAGIARDAAGRGARVLLLESGDLAQGTSSASTKLIHGGLRYLEHSEFSLVRESLQERERLWAIAPHIIRPMRFVLPHVDGLRPAWMLRLGLLLYDHIGGRKLLPPTRIIKLGRHSAGVPLAKGFSKGFEYSDCWVDDARLVVLNAMDVAERNGEVLTRTKVDAARRENGHWVIDTSAGPFRARALVNAAGPVVLDVAAAVGERPDYDMRLVRGSHIVTRRLFDHEYAYFFQLPDGRIFFAIPYEQDFTLIGTTDVEHDGQLNDVRASEAEIAYLCDGVNRYFAKAISPADVIWSYAGVRPLIDDGSGKPEAATRGYRLELSEANEGAPLLTVYGGKITTYRHLSEEAGDLLATRLTGMSGRRWTAFQALPGGNFAAAEFDSFLQELRGRYPFLGPQHSLRIGRAYGTRAYRLLGTAREWADLGKDFGAGLSQAEVGYLREQEWAVTAEDVLWRRTKLGLHFDAAQVEALANYLAAGSVN